MDASLVSTVVNLGAAVLGALLLIVFKGQEAKIKSLDTQLSSVIRNVEDKDEARRARFDIQRDIEEHTKRDEKMASDLNLGLKEFRTEALGIFETTRIEGNQKREEIRSELQGYRDETSRRVETVRTETNARLDAVNVKIDGLVNQISALALMRVREQHDNTQRTNA